jgi:hypothetical protein
MDGVFTSIRLMSVEYYVMGYDGRANSSPLTLSYLPKMRREKKLSGKGNLTT